MLTWTGGREAFVAWPAPRRTPWCNDYSIRVIGTCGLLSNGQRLRLLRNSASLIGSAYLEFDIQAIFEGELFPDFVPLYRLAHASRLKIRDESIGPASCLLEERRAYGARQGEPTA
jgi:hypothetical protein